MSAAIRLYSNAGCPYAQRARIVLLEKGLAFDYVEVDLASKPDWFAEVSPTGKVPVLVDDGFRVYESAIIAEYLDEQYPLPRLLPVEAKARTDARLWIHRAGDFARAMFWAAVAGDEQAVSRHVSELEQQLAEMEQAVFADGRPWWLGDVFSLVDASFYPACERLVAVVARSGLDLSAWPQVQGWMQRVRARPAVAATVLPASEHVANFAALSARMGRRERV